MRTLCYSVELLSPLRIKNNVKRACTVDAGSFLGFGPLFFGAVESDHSFSLFSLAVDIFLAAEGIIVGIVLVVVFEAGKGQSLPP